MEVINNQKWFTTEAEQIQKTASVSPEEAEQILKQRILDYAKNHNLSEEEATAHYSKVRKNTKTKTL